GLIELFELDGLGVPLGQGPFGVFPLVGPLGGAAEDARLGDWHGLIGKQSVDSITRIARLYRFYLGVIDAADVAKLARLVEDEDVRRGQDTVGSGGLLRLAVIEVREREFFVLG